jgi:pyruvate/2-oxoglutarate dehydrogenase complex dihydrolipoamide acyltransferase (E2) component
MPKLSETMKEGRVVRWLKAVGEKVEAGEPILEIEAEKVTVQVEAPCTGTLKEILVPEGGVASVGEPLALIEEA